MTYLFKYRFIVLFSLIAALLYTHYYINRAHVEIKIYSPVQTYFKIYWASEGEQSYSEEKMARIRINPQQEEYSFFIGDLRKADTLRIDPSGTKGKVTVKEIRISQPGLPDIQISNEEEFAGLRAFGDVKSTTFSSSGWEVFSTGSHPRFQFHLPLEERNLNWAMEMVRFLLLLFSVLIVLRFFEPLWSDHSYTAYCGIFIIGLILTMAVISKQYYHPDEIVHVSAARYYADHWLPPDVESPDIRDTYSIYGFSRLNTLEPSYLLAGKLAAILSPFNLDSTLSYRLFNVLLFSILTFLAFKNTIYRLMFIPLLISPQIWYIFSYMNSDALGLFVAILTGWQVVSNDSSFNRFIEGRRIPMLRILGLGILFSLLLLAKKPFYFFILFLLFYFGWRYFFQPYGNLKGTLTRLSIIACIGISCVAVRVTADISVNGWDKGEKMRKMQEVTAHYTYKPSTELTKKHIHLQMRERGTSLKSFLIKHRWGEKTFRSAVGTYGYMTVAASSSYYNMMRIAGLASLLFVGLSILIRGGWSGNLLFGGAIVCSAVLITVACHRAWTVDFQAQGRYLFAIVAILGMVLVKTGHVYNKTLLRISVCSMFLLSVYSFIWIALMGIPKYI